MIDVSGHQTIGLLFHAQSLCRLIDLSDNETIGLVFGAPSLCVNWSTFLVTKQAACSLMRRVCESIDRRFWQSKSRPALAVHRDCESIDGAFPATKRTPSSVLR